MLFIFKIRHYYKKLKLYNIENYLMLEYHKIWLEVVQKYSNEKLKIKVICLKSNRIFKKHLKISWFKKNTIVLENMYKNKFYRTHCIQSVILSSSSCLSVVSYSFFEPIINQFHYFISCFSKEFVSFIFRIGHTALQYISVILYISAFASVIFPILQCTWFFFFFSLLLLDSLRFSKIRISGSRGRSFNVHDHICSSALHLSLHLCNSSVFDF